MRMITIANVMTRSVRTVDASESIAAVARTMESLNVGSLPVREGARLVGIVTDRDLTLRAVARGLKAETPVAGVMTTRVKVCFEDEPVDQVETAMQVDQVRRIPVINRERALVGIVALGDLATRGEAPAAARVLSDVSTPSRPIRSSLWKGAGQRESSLTRPEAA